MSDEYSFCVVAVLGVLMSIEFRFYVWTETAEFSICTFDFTVYTHSSKYMYLVHDRHEAISYITGCIQFLPFIHVENLVRSSTQSTDSIHSLLRKDRLLNYVQLGSECPTFVLFFISIPCVAARFTVFPCQYI